MIATVDQETGQVVPTGRGVVLSLPDRIRVAGYDFTIQKWTPQQAQGAMRWGEFSSSEQIIRIQIEMPTRFKAVDTFLHEMAHAIFWSYGVQDEDKEERIVGLLGTAWMQVHRDNLWLAKWLGDALR